MKNRRIEVKLGKTLNMQDYEFLRVDIGISVDIENDEDLGICYNQTAGEVESFLKDEIQKQIEEWE